MNYIQEKKRTNLVKNMLQQKKRLSGEDNLFFCLGNSLLYKISSFLSEQKNHKS